MLVVVVTVMPILDMETLLVHLMETQMSQMLVIQVYPLMPLEVHGTLKHHQLKGETLARDGKQRKNTGDHPKCHFCEHSVQG